MTAAGSASSRVSALASGESDWERFEKGISAPAGDHVVTNGWSRIYARRRDLLIFSELTQTRKTVSQTYDASSVR
jgi:hypothetical protein